ncbi:MAG: S8 family serine peptidase, partial [Chloroflexi bacterium]|nr:S8 family serine peptidase [Chloroflexota bacterium]
PDLADDLVHEECFMAGSGLSSRCPNETGRQSGPGAAEDDLGHGTNVAGIITGAGTVAPKGVAPAAGIEAFKIIDKTNSLVFSDLTAALDHILASHPDVDIINMSLGTFFGFPPGTCEGGSEPYNTLRAAGVILFAASMNEGSKAGTGYPACVKSVVSVGAVYDANIGSYAGFACTDTTTSADKVACWSNSDSSLDLLGPGCRITASGRFGGSSTYCGTSQATPHAAGVAALLVGADPTYTPDRLESALKSTGVLITDPANDVTTPRLDALAAISLDSDGDGKPDVSDNCPFWPNPAQNLPLWAVPPGDPDCDGFSTADEALIGTDPYKRCGANWPANINNAGNSANKVDIFDVNALAPPVFLSTAPGPPYTPRKDIARSPPSTNGRIDIFDVNKMAPPVFFATCVP